VTLFWDFYAFDWSKNPAQPNWKAIADGKTSAATD
jgi:hypothetical protein